MEESLPVTESIAPQSITYSKEQWHQILDFLQQEWQGEQQVECALVHVFTPGLYSRRIVMPAYAIIMSKWHKTEHQFVVTKGVVDVLNVEDMSVVRIVAPYNGITPAGTRRILFIHEETEWTTFHSTNQTTVEGVEEEIIEPRDITALVEKAKEELA